MPNPVHAGQVAAPPYDVVTVEEAADLAGGNPLHFLHVTRAEIDLPEKTRHEEDRVLAQGASTLRRFMRDGTLLRDEQPGLYIYELAWRNLRQTGIVCCCRVEDYRHNIIRRHEKTRSKTEAERTRHINALNAHTGPVFLTYRGREDIDRQVGAAARGEPLMAFLAPDGVHHAVWRVEETEALIEAFGNVPAAYIADGHHRAASAANVADERRKAEGHPGGDREYDGFLTVLFPSEQLHVLPYNRVVADLNGLTAEAFMDAVRSRFAVQPAENGDVPDRGRMRMYMGDRWHELSWDPDAETDPVARLDISVLQDRLLSPVLGVDDPRTSDRIGFVGGIKGAEALKHRVDTHQAAVAFSMYPVAIEDLMTIADAGRIMPPKSTWFEPKLRSGLFVHSLEE